MLCGMKRIANASSVPSAPVVALPAVALATLALAAGAVLPGAGCTQSKAATSSAEKIAQPPERPPERLPEHIQTTLSHGPRWLGTYTSSPRTFRTNSYWLEGPDGLVLIDTQFLPSAGLEAVELAETITGKKVVAAIVLHANPDKFNGTTALQKRGVRVITSAQVIALIPAVHALRRAWFHDRYKPDYPDKAPAPESFGDRSTTVTLAGLEIELHVMGPGASEAHVVAEYQGHVFVGDLVAGMGHSWLELGLLDEWHERLDEIAALEPEVVHPGRGPSGDAALLARQKAYLDEVITRMRAEKPRADAPDETRAAAVDRVAESLFADHPGYSFERFVSIGLPAVWDRLAGTATE